MEAQQHPPPITGARDTDGQQRAFISLGAALFQVTLCHSTFQPCLCYLSGLNRAEKQMIRHQGELSCLDLKWVTLNSPVTLTAIVAGLMAT